MAHRYVTLPAALYAATDPSGSVVLETLSRTRTDSWTALFRHTRRECERLIARHQERLRLRQRGFQVIELELRQAEPLRIPLPTTPAPELLRPIV